MGACSSQQNETQKNELMDSDPASGPQGAAHSKCSKCFDTQQQQGADRGADRRTPVLCVPRPVFLLLWTGGGATVHRARGAGRREEG